MNQLYVNKTNQLQQLKWICMTWLMLNWQKMNSSMTKKLYVTQITALLNKKYLNFHSTNFRMFKEKRVWRFNQLIKIIKFSRILNILINWLSLSWVMVRVRRHQIKERIHGGRMRNWKINITVTRATMKVLM
jgi:hypothetical protein